MDSAARCSRNKSSRRNSNSDLLERTSPGRPLQQPHVGNDAASKLKLRLDRAEDGRMLSPKLEDCLESLPYRRPRLPSSVQGELRVITHVNKLIAGSASVVGIPQTPARKRTNFIDQLDERNCV